ncbi:MAG: AMP-binding protein [Eubacteriales bacterium]|nr:AMP-binding protein [Eubacteriales bacterium]
MDINYVDSYYKVRNIVSLKDMLNSSAELFKNKPAFLIKKEKGGEYFEVKYNQLKKDVDALGTKLMEMGLSGSKIAIIGENCYQWVVAYFAVVNGVGVVVPLDKELNKEEIYHLLETSDCKAVFYTETFEDILREYKIDYKIRMEMYDESTDLTHEGIIKCCDLVRAGEQLIKGGDRCFLDTKLDPEEMRMLLFTSGTTGTSKGIMLCHRNVISNIMDTCRIVKVTSDDRTLSILPIHHTFECTLGILTVLYSGASSAFFEGLKYIAKNLVEAQATILVGVPLIFESVHNKIWRQAEKVGKAKTLHKAIKFNRFLKTIGLSADKKLFGSIYDSFGGKLRMMVTGAAAIDPNVSRGFEDLGIRVLQGYGLTECSPLVTGTPDFSNTYKKAGSVGPVVPSGKLKIIDKDENGIGEILYQGPNVMLGYYNMPEETEKVLKDGWFHTGDLGFLDESGWLYITGRKKNVIVTKTGKNIYPEEVEFYVNRNPYILESMVYGIEEKEGEGMTVGIQVRPNYDLIHEKHGLNCNDDSIFALIKKAINETNEKMPIYKRIRHISIRKDEFIKTTTKKIKRHKNTRSGTLPCH